MPAFRGGRRSFSGLKQKYSLPGREFRVCLGRALGARRRWCGRMGAQEHSEDRADPGRALDLEKSAVMVEDVLDDGQAEPGAAHFARSCGVGPVEAFSQPGQVLARYS